MRFDVITLFPELFAPHFVHGVTRRAFESGQVEVKLWQLRDFGDPPHARVDDRPYGGGPGMVLLVEPLLRALAAVRADRGDAEPVPVVNFSPAGRPLRQAAVGEFASGRGAILLCARYEGVDQRFIDAPGRHRAQRRRLRAVRRRDPGAGPARCGRAPAARRPRRRALARAGQLFRRPARLPALQPARGAGRGRRGRGGAAGAALGQPRGDRALAPRPGPGADRRAPPRPRRRGRGRRPARARPTGPPSPGPGRQSYNSGFSDPLPRRGPRAPTHLQQRAHDRPRSTPWT